MTMDAKEILTNAAKVAFVALFLLGFVGWGMNIVKAFYMLDGPITAMFVARAVGVFVAPIGAILGWL